MSRFDYRDPGTDPAYCDPLRAEDDINVPDFDQPDPPVDPAEHAAQAVTGGLTFFAQQIALCTNAEFERAMQLWKMAMELERHATQATNKASNRVNEILKRRR